jgi:predicted thioesterase
MERHMNGHAELVVSGNDLATVLVQTAADNFPPVLATARLIGLMETAAARALHASLGEGQVSVGISINVSHSAATPLGVRVVAEARLTGMEGKFYVFDVTARDAGGEIGRGTHKRAIVNVDRLLAGAVKRLATGT